MDGASAKQSYEEAKALFRAGKYAEAVRVLDPLERAYPNSKNILLAKAECLIGLGWHEDAEALCERALRQQDDARGRRLLEAARDGMEPDAASPLDVDLDESLSDAFEPVAPPREFPRRAIGLAALGAAGIVLVAGALWLRIRVETANTGAAAFSEAELERFEERHRARRAEELRSKPIEPGRVIPRAEWEPLAPNGAPAWKAGIYRRVPCPGYFYEGPNGLEPRTIDVYIPVAYDRNPDELFPTLTISMARGNPRFIKLTDWAESRNVILIALNSSRNKSFDRNYEAQDAAFELLSTTLRAHPTLNFAAGMSGGAQSSWRMVLRRPGIFSGLLMMGQGGYDTHPVPPHVRVAYIRGQHEPNTSWINHNARILRANGNEVRIRVVPGAHVTGPPEVRMAMLDWMLESARRDLAKQEDAAAATSD